jgi:transposase
MRFEFCIGLIKRMGEVMFKPEEIEVYDVYHLPIIKAYADRIDLVNTINRLVPTRMEIEPGIMVLAMVLDALSGRHPLYRIDSFYKNKDIELLLGRSIDVEKLTDDNFGRCLDHLYEANTSELYSAIVMNALRNFDVPTEHIHYDTTSMNVFGKYNSEGPESPKTIKITKGYSKDHRPDLNQFVVSLLCTGGNVPIFSKLENGNASDKKLNNTLLTEISKKLASVGIDPAGTIYIADSAMVTEENLRLMGDETLFITRLPANFKEHQRLIEEAVQSESWQDYGILASTVPTRNRPGVHYRGYETTVTLYEREYRAVVTHSSAHDRRRQKRLDREIERELTTWSKKLAEIQKTVYFCMADTQAAMARLQEESLRYHEIELTMEERPQFNRGRPKADGSRTLKQMRYAIKGTLRQKTEAVSTMREQAGCFVLITNVHPEGLPNANVPYNGKKVLQAYKDQNGIEHNFGFLKDPVLVNAVFLKKPERIEALGLILVMSLLLWRLIELSMRSHLETEQTAIPGWDNKPTERPTTFMMTTKFDNIRIIKIRHQRALNGRLSRVQETYIAALGLTSAIFTQPVGFQEPSG